MNAHLSLLKSELQCLELENHLMDDPALRLSEFDIRATRSMQLDMQAWQEARLAGRIASALAERQRKVARVQSDNRAHANTLEYQRRLALASAQQVERTQPEPIQKPPVRANTRVIFSGQEPTPDVKDLCFRLANRGKKSERQTALEFTRQNKGKAESLLSQIRRLERKGRVRFETA